MSDIKYIRCDVCKLMAKHAHSTVVKKRKEKANKKLAEMDIIEAIEKLTDPLRTEGHWISSTDLQEKGDKLQLVNMGKLGECGRECKTIAKAAEQILGEHDTDLAEVLLKGKKKRAELTQWLCYELSDACSKPTPPLPKDRERGPPFTPLPAGVETVVNMMGEMRAKGMRGKLVNPDEAMANGGYMGGEDGDDDDDNDDGMFGMANGQFPGMGGNFKAVNPEELEKEL